MKRTALYDKHIALGGRMVEFAGYELPVQYSGILEEHRAVREAAGVFDVSHMGEFIFTGQGAEGALNALLTNDIRGMADGRVRYSLLPNERGGAVDDVLVYRVNAEKFLVVVNGANVEKDAEHVRAHLSGCGFEDVSESVSQIAVQGPRAEEIMRAVVESGELPAKYYTFTRHVIIAGAGGAAHLPGMVAAMTTLPVVGVPVKSRALNGLDSLLSIVQMPAGVPVATVAINGAKNAALIAASILALQDSGVAERLEKFRRDQTGAVLEAEI